MTNSVIDDMESIAEVLKVEGIAESIRIGSFPAKYSDGLATIRSLPTKAETLNNVFYKQLRPYQIVIYGSRVPDVLRRVELAMNVFSRSPKMKVEKGYLTVDDGIGFSEVLLDEDENIWFSIGVLQASTFKAREQNEYKTLRELYVENITDLKKSEGE